MVMLFWTTAALLLAAALMFVLPPLLKGDEPPARASRRAANARLYREELAQLEGERAAGSLDPAQYEIAKRDIERRLLEDAGADDAVASRAGRRARHAAAAAVALALPIVAVLLYSMFGNPRALESSSEPARATHAVTPEQIAALTARLAERLQRSPEDADGWRMLARSLAVLGRYAEAAQAYERLAAIVPEDAGVLADYADVLAMARGRRLAGEPYAIVKRALALDPGHIKALALAGSAEFELKNFPAAIAHWERLLALVPEDSDFARSIRGSIAQARGAGRPERGQPSAGGAIVGTVRLAPELAGRVAAQDTLFVLARSAKGGRMPLAIVRAKAGDLPYEFRLDDSHAMNPGTRLSEEESVVVEARISRSGQATPQPGDLFAVSPPLRPGSGRLQLTIDRSVR
jgi:cytochrome c-type biogenesis protein CcmH